MIKLLGLVIVLTWTAPAFAHKEVKPEDKTELDATDPIKLVREYMKKAEQGLASGQTSSGTIVAQEEAMILLDKLIKAAEQQQKEKEKENQDQNKQEQQQKNKSNGQQEKQQEQQEKQQQKQQEQEEQQSEKEKQEQKASQNDKPSEQPKPGEAEIPPASGIEARGEEWGTLPPQLRRELIEGMRENLPEKYKELLKSYYKKLAEIE
ncbi:MAG: hypothetical protein O3B01_21485 [Planctomycetota bacterium]|nr:hypothetical protein [Planctomycetota bacterium]MDA1141147.1 hypothetical protein [Planctomycetota bacterium]